MGFTKLLTLFLIVLLTYSAVRADTLEQELTSLKEKLGKQLVAKGRKKVAAVDFTDLQGQRNELGRYLAEQLTVELVGTEGISVLDRANLKSILEEHKLTEEGLVKPENAKKLGQFSGVDAILIGNITTTDADIVLLVKAISTDTAEVIAAGRARFAKSPELQQLLNKGIGSGSETSGVTGQSSAGSVDTAAIAMKELGQLRITLKNVSPLRNRGRGARGDEDMITGIVCSFDFANLDLKRTMKVAYIGKAIAAFAGSGGQSHFERHAKLTDSAGHEWRLFESTGLPMVACGYHGDASAITRLVQTGKYIAGDKLFDEYVDSTSWGGDFISLEPGKGGRVSLTFRDLDNKSGEPTDYGTKAIDHFQLEADLILGVCEPGHDDAKYSLEALVLDKIVMPKTP